MSDYPENLSVRPLQVWPGTRTLMQERSPFSASLDVTLGALDRELRAISARDAELQVAIQPSAFRRDGRPNKRAIAEHPGVVLTFSIIDGGERLPVVVPLRQLPDLEGQPARHRPVDGGPAEGEPLRRHEKGRAVQGLRRAAAAEADRGLSRTEAQELIDGYGGETRALRATHPDTGGDAEKFREVQDARQVLGLVSHRGQRV